MTVSYTACKTGSMFLIPEIYCANLEMAVGHTLFSRMQTQYLLNIFIHEM